MTRIDKSEAQLDAEAHAPLSELVRKHRIYYRRDLYIPRLATDEPPVFTNPDTGERTADEMSMIGPTLSWPLTSYISESFGRTFLWSRAAYGQWAICRRSHPEHRDREAFRGSLCKMLVGMVIRQGWEPDRVAVELQLDRERVAEALRSALKAIDREMERLVEGGVQRFREDQGRFTLYDEPPVHHAVPGLHMQDCPQCRRTNAA